MSSADFVEVEFFETPNDRQVFAFTVAEKVVEVAKWIAEVLPEQPRSVSEIGAVYPWCKVAFFHRKPAGERAFSCVTIYNVRDRTTGEILVSADQRQRLLNILDLVEIGQRKYERKRGEARSD